jgi:hypothetical protein
LGSRSFRGADGRGGGLKGACSQDFAGLVGMIAESQDPDQRFLCNRLLGSPESRHSLLTAEFICTITQARFHTVCLISAASPQRSRVAKFV